MSNPFLLFNAFTAVVNGVLNIQPLLVMISTKTLQYMGTHDSFAV